MFSSEWLLIDQFVEIINSHIIDSRGGYFSHQNNKPSQHGHQLIWIEIRSIIATYALDHLRASASNSPCCVGVNERKNRTQIFYFRFLSSLSVSLSQVIWHAFRFYLYKVIHQRVQRKKALCLNKSSNNRIGRYPHLPINETKCMECRQHRPATDEKIRKYV